LAVIYVRDNNIFSPAEKQRVTPHFTWVMDKALWDGEIAVFSDSFLTEAHQYYQCKKVAWLLEPPAILPGIYDYIRTNYPLFDLIFTFDKSLLALNPRFRYWPMGSTWIPEPDRRVYPKSKGTSIIASAKNHAPGHVLRHQVVKRHGKDMDVMGRGYRTIETKLEGLKDYRYSFAIENMRLDCYFTEKLIDCFMTGTVPIYWGCPAIEDFFDGRGMVILTDPETFNMGSLTEDDYNRRRPYIEKNFELAKKYTDLEKNLWDNGLKDLHG